MVVSVLVGRSKVLNFARWPMFCAVDCGDSQRCDLSNIAAFSSFDVQKVSFLCFILITDECKKFNAHEQLIMNSFNT